MKRLFLIAAVLGMASSASAAAPKLIGGTTDAHGCIGPAGYQWSIVQRRCIRAFEAGYKLEALPAGSNVAGAYVVFPMGADQTRAELYIPSERGSLIAPRIRRPGPPMWQVGSYRLIRADGLYKLSRGKKLLFQGPAPH